MTIKNAFAIPEELRLLKQWILWKYEDKGSSKPTKVPYSIAHNLASVTNPNDWSTFNEAFNIYQLGSYDGLGFVFTNADLYSFIDLDDCSSSPNAKSDMERQLKIFKEFNSYSEVSPSGKGLHIIVKGNLPQGRRRSFIELYSSQRYATMTGNVYNDVPIADRNELLNILFKQMGGGNNVSHHNGNAPQTHDDSQIIEQASNASNGEKFKILNSGDWQSIYQSQSEADFAYIDIIAFYTQNKEQIARIFRASPLGQRKKAQRNDYIEWMINKSFDKLPPAMDFDGFRIALEEKIAQQSVDSANSDVYQENIAGSINGKSAPFEGVNVGSNPSPATEVSPSGSRPTAHNSPTAGSNPATSTNASLAQGIEHPPSKRKVEGSTPSGSAILPPPGLVGEIAQFIYSAAPRPVPEIALAAAIGFMAGICGRAYNVSGTGLNQYILLLANTGTGKESMASGIDKIINEVSMQVPVAGEFIGPSEIASGQALIKFLANKSQSFVSILGEFGKRLQVMSDPRANGAEKTLNRMMLDLYNKSGHGQVARPSIYADSEKNTNLISSPAFSILAESTPETFYSALTEEMIADGLLPRFMLIEYNGPRPALNENHRNAQFNDGFIGRIADLMAIAKTVMANRKVTDVMIDDDAAQILHKFDKLADNKINSTDKEVVRQLWNRAHIKVLKISALIAVGVNCINPVVTKDYVSWAKNVVEDDIKTLTAKFESGLIGRNSEEVKQYELFKKHVVEFTVNDWNKIKVYCNKQEQVLHSHKYIPMSFLINRVSKLSPFRKDKNGGNFALKRCISIALNEGLIVQINKSELIKLGKTATCYMISDASSLYKDI